MRRILLAAALLLAPSAAAGQQRSHFWLYRNPQTGASGWGYRTPSATLQFGTSPRQERIYHFTPAYPAYNYGGFNPTPWQGGFNPNPWYGGFGAAY